jgi:hypothetical protein
VKGHIKSIQLIKQDPCLIVKYANIVTVIHKTKRKWKIKKSKIKLNKKWSRWVAFFCCCSIKFTNLPIRSFSLNVNLQHQNERNLLIYFQVLLFLILIVALIFCSYWTHTQKIQFLKMSKLFIFSQKLILKFLNWHAFGT